MTPRAPTNPRTFEPGCPSCQKPQHLCVCSAIDSVQTRIEVLILRHPQEQDRELGTARIAEMQIKNCVVKTGLSWRNMAQALGRAADPKKWGVLYLGAKGAPPTNQTLTIVDAKGEALANQSALKSLEGIILLDGSWAQAKTLWWRNAWLLKCARLVLKPPRPSLYGRLRKEPRRNSVSTLEAAAYALAELEGDASLPEKIFPPFRELLRKARGKG